MNSQQKKSARFDYFQRVIKFINYLQDLSHPKKRSQNNTNQEWKARNSAAMKQIRKYYEQPCNNNFENQMKWKIFPQEIYNLPKTGSRSHTKSVLPY